MSGTRNPLAGAAMLGRWLLLALLLSFSGAAAAVHDVMLSTAPDRSNPVALNGTTVSGDIYVFTSPETDTSQVNFWLDDPERTGAPFHTENLAPWDLARTAADGTAVPFDTTTLTNGTHTLTTEVVLGDGTSTELFDSVFEVQNAAALQFSQSSVAFSVQEGGSASESVTLSASDAGGADFSLSSNAAWLSASPINGTSPATIAIAVDAAGLAVGSYSARISASASGYEPTSLDVTLTVTAGYELLVSAASDRSSAVALDSSSVAGDIHVFTAPETDTQKVEFYLDDTGMNGTPIQTENLGPFDLAGTARDGSANPFDSTTLTDGTHTLTAAITLTDGSRQSVTAAFGVANADKALAFTPESLSFSAGSGTNPDSQGLSLAAVDGSAGDYSVTSDAPWLGVSPATGTTPASLTAAVDTSGLAVGSYSATLTAIASGYVGATASVTLEVTGTSSYGVLLSASPDRSSPVGLDGQSVSGDIYVFTGPDDGVDRVTFYLDDIDMSGTPAQVEKLAPYDLAGTATSGAANPFDTTTLADGTHTLTTHLELTSGATQTLDVQFTVDNTLPVLTVSPTPLSFSATVGDGTSGQNVQLDTGDGAAAGYSVSSDAAWLSAEPGSGTTPEVVTVTVDPGGLVAGSYSGTLTFTSDTHQTESLPVSFEVSEVSVGYDLLLSASPDRSSPVSIAGQTVSGDMYVFTGPDEGVKRVSFYFDDPALSGTPLKVENIEPYDLGGTANSGDANPFDSSLWSDGSHTLSALIEFTDGGSQQIDATFAVHNDVPALTANPASLAFSIIEGDPAADQALQLDTSDGVAADYSLVSDAAWLSAAPASGTTPLELTVTADPTGLAAGSYSGNLTISAGTHEDLVVPVTLEVAAQSATYSLLLSHSSDRSNPVALSGQVVSGDVYVFTGPDDGVSRVDFFLDDPSLSGAPYHSEGYAPFDLAQTARDGTANPFSTLLLANGTHNITVVLTRDDGSSETISADFEVDNPIIALPFTDDFSSDSGNWSVVDDSGVSSSWGVTGGRYRQAADVGDSSKGTPFDQSYHRGTYAYATDLLGLTDYRFEVEMYPIEESPPAHRADGKDMGVMVRYTDSGNYYRFALNQRNGYARLEKRVNGSFEPLAVSARGYEHGTNYHVAVTVRGDHIHVALNGEPLFAVADPDLAGGSVALYVQDSAAFDNVAVTELVAEPQASLAGPLAYSSQDAATVAVRALADNVPADGSVVFSRDGIACSNAGETLGYFSADCGSWTSGDHTLEVQVLNGSGGVVAGDLNARVGIGRYRVAMGDSITAGKGDHYAADNRSADGRAIGSDGYTAPLTGLLTDATGNPDVVFNEGVPADETVDGLARIDSILARHAAADEVLLMYGTNDSYGSLPRPSGLGCRGSACNGTFKQKMQQLVDTLAAAGKPVAVPQIPPAWGSGSTRYSDPLSAERNLLIQEYNEVIRTELNGIARGPDLFGFMLTESVNRASLFSDDLHPNSFGYVVMANLWRDDLAGPATLPFLLEEFAPDGYQQNLLEAGDVCYVDGNWRLTAMPSALATARWVMTAQGDAGSSAQTQVSFTVDRPVTVYVAYDAGASALPDWMAGFADTGMTLSTENPHAPTLRVYRADYSSGSVSLGGNAAAGAAGADGNYLVAVRPQ